LPEFVRGPVVAILIQVFTAVVVQFLQPFYFFLHPLARFLFALALLLFFVSRLLRVLQRISGLHANCLELTGARGCRRQQQRGDCDPGRACLSN